MAKDKEKYRAYMRDYMRRRRAKSTPAQCSPGPEPLVVPVVDCLPVDLVPVPVVDGGLGRVDVLPVVVLPELPPYAIPPPAFYRSEPGLRCAWVRRNWPTVDSDDVVAERLEEIKARGWV